MQETLNGSLSKQILVSGFYFKENLGDDLFADAFKYLFPQFSFTFTNRITKLQLQNIDAVFIGGGSFLDQVPSVAPDAWNLLMQQKIFYIGVGTETNLHPEHIKLIKIAQLIASRNGLNLDEIKKHNHNIFTIADLVYYLPITKQKKIAPTNSICIVPNILVVPKWQDAHWKHAAWQFFKSEFSQCQDELSIKYKISNVFNPRFNS